MPKRFVSLWFRHLTTDWLTLRRPELAALPFVFAGKDHGRLIIRATNKLAEAQGIHPGMVVADARAVVPGLVVVDEIPSKAEQLLKALGLWCIRYTPLVAVDLPCGLIFDVSGCTHLWGGESAYLKEIILRLKGKGYDVRGAMADTIGTAWAIARYGRISPIIESYGQATALLHLPPAALRLEPLVLERLYKLGLNRVETFIRMPRSALRRRFGNALLQRLNQALGQEDEPMTLLQPVAPYEERLPCLEPVKTAAAIEIAIRQLLEMLCKRLMAEGKGLRTAILKGYRVDGKVEQTGIGTNRASCNSSHLFRLFELKIATIEPDLGIELFTLEAPKVEDVSPEQEVLWATEGCGLDNLNLVELLDRLANKVGADTIRRYLPQEHYWPERSVKLAASLQEKPTTGWRDDKPRPVQLLARPERVKVTALIPDYPPMLFIYRDEIHHIKKSDGPERIEREWWMDEGEHRDYYQVEDHAGQRYWLFRSGHYSGARTDQWFIHGFFA